MIVNGRKKILTTKNLHFPAPRAAIIAPEFKKRFGFESYLMVSCCTDWIVDIGDGPVLPAAADYAE